MAIVLSRLEFRLNDTINGEPLTTETVDLPTLRGFLDDIEAFIKGDMPDAPLSESRVEIRDGSLRVITYISALIIGSVQIDLDALNTTHNLDAIHPKRAEIVEKWQVRAQQSVNRSYSLWIGERPSPVLINKDNNYLHRSKNLWVNTETYMTGRVVDLGGKTTPRVHLVGSDTGQSIRVLATEDQLSSLPNNFLYREVTLYVTGEQHLETKEFRDLHLIQFTSFSSSVDEDVLKQLWERGRKAWRGVSSAARWVEELRGNTP